MTAALENSTIAFPQPQNTRRTSQAVVPADQDAASGSYELYPSFPVSAGVVGKGFSALARQIAGQRCVRIDGFVGVLWERFRDSAANRAC